MRTHMYYVIHLQEDIHVLCDIVTWRYARIMYYIYMKILGGCAKESLKEVEEQSDIEADGDINNAMPPKSQMSLRHTVSQFMTIWNGPMADFAAQGSWTCCWRNATLVPASWSDPLPRERVRNLGPRGHGVASFMVLTIPDTHNWKHHKPTHMNNKIRKMSMCQKPYIPRGGRHLYGNAPLRDVWVL